MFFMQTTFIVLHLPIGFHATTSMVDKTIRFVLSSNETQFFQLPGQQTK